jgi:hypothetical protein
LKKGVVRGARTRSCEQNLLAAGYNRVIDPLQRGAAWRARGISDGRAAKAIQPGRRPGPAVKIYLLLIDRERFFFYSDESESSHEDGEAEDTPSSAQRGVRGWLHDRYAKFKGAWQHADSGALLWMRRAWDWLHSLAHPDEAMLARLRTARRVDLHHPAARQGRDVCTIWQDYLSRQWRRHLFWMGLNGVIAPFTVIFALLPGPNLIGYWFAYRAVHHALILWGIRRVRRNKVPTELQPVTALDLPLERDGAGKARHAALNGALVRLDDHVARCHDSPLTTVEAHERSTMPAPGEPGHAKPPAENP